MQVSRTIQMDAPDVGDAPRRAYDQVRLPPALVVLDVADARIRELLDAVVVGNRELAARGDCHAPASVDPLAGNGRQHALVGLEGVQQQLDGAVESLQLPTA